MKSYITVLLIISVFASARAQKECKYKPKKFHKYRLGITSDQGGFYSNAYTVQTHDLQIESNLAHGEWMKFDTMVFASASQLRYGISSKLELKLGYAYVQPFEAQADTGTYSQLLAGIKGTLFTVERRNIEWNAALSGSYFIENIGREGPVFPGGYYIIANNSLKFFRLINLDTMVGFMQNLNRNTMLGLLSAQLFIKPDELKVGFFTGIGGMYIESYINIGILVTDNYSYMMHFSLMSMDNNVALNICCTYCLSK